MCPYHKAYVAGPNPDGTGALLNQEGPLEEQNGQNVDVLERGCGRRADMTDAEHSNNGRLCFGDAENCCSVHKAGSSVRGSASAEGLEDS